MQDKLKASMLHPFSRWCSMLMVCTVLALNASAQCLNTSAYGSVTAPAAIGGTATVNCEYASNFMAVNSVVAGYTYQLTSTISTDYATVRIGTYNGAVVANGVQPLIFTASSSGSYYVHWNTNATCGTNDGCRNVTITRIHPPCSGTPLLGNAASTNGGPVCQSTSFILSLNPALALSGVTLQWEVSTAGEVGPYTAIAGQTNATATITGQQQNSWYRLAVFCTSSGLTGASGAVNVTQQLGANCYCTPTYQYNNQYGHIDSVKLGTINNVTGQNVPVTNNYYSYVTAPAANQTTDLAQGFAQTISIGIGGSGTYNCVTAWIDFDADGEFESGEQLGTASFQLEGNQNFTFTVPATAVLGPTRLRVREVYGYPVTDPCSNVNSYGETEDYLVTIVEATPCTGVSVATTIAANGPTTFCQGGLVTLTASGASSYLWSNGATTTSISVSTAATYGVTGTNSIGCTGAATPATVTVNTLPTVSVNANGPTTFCQSGSVILTASGASTYLWSNNTTTTSITVSSAGTYSVVGSTDEGCTSTSTNSITVFVDPLPTVSINANGPLSFCPGGSVSLTASGATSYSWSNSATTTSINISSNGSFSVTGTDANGCSGASSATTVTVNTLPSVSIGASGTLSLCPGGSVTLTAYGASTYLWSNNATTNDITVSDAGSYSVTGTNADGCTAASGTTAVSAANINNCYCIPVYEYGNETGYLNYVQLGTINNITGRNATYSSYVNAPAPTQTTDLVQGSQDTITVNVQGTTDVNVVSAWIDFNQDGDFFDAGEELGIVPDQLNGDVAIAFTVPATATLGATRLRVRGTWYGPAFDPCGIAHYGEAEDYTVTIVAGTPCTGQALVVSIAANGPTVFCENGLVELTASGATTYLWSNGATTSSITVSTAGSYAVTGTGDNGCTGASAPTTVVVNPLPTVSITADGATTFCEGSSVTLTASGATSYLWSNNATTTSITVSTAGSYSAVGTNANGCSSQSTPTTVTVNSLPSISINANGATTLCAGGLVELTASGAASYLWSNNATTSSISVANAGSYSVIGTDANNCSATSNAVDVSVSSQLEISISANGPLTFCNGGSVTLTASGASSYSWSNSATTTSIVVSQAGSYSVTGTSVGGCSGVATPVTVSVNPIPVISLIADGSAVFCQGDSVTLIASGATTYAWSTGETTSSIVASTEGNYSVTGTTNGCSSAPNSYEVVVNALPVVSISANGATQFCTGDSVTLSASGAVSYLWNTGATSISITALTSDYYTVTGTNASGCTAVSDYALVTVIDPPVVNIEGIAVLTPCGASVTLIASGATTYVWSNGATGSNLLVTETGTYYVTGTGAGGCTASAGPVVQSAPTAPTVNIDADGPLSFCEGGSVTLTASGASSYLWSNGETTTSIDVTTGGTYSVVGNIFSDCIDTSETVTVNVTNNVLVEIIADGSTNLCPGGSVTLTASGASSFVWSNGATTTSITVSDAGSYSVIGTNAGGCSGASAPVAVSVNNAPVSSIEGFDSVCPGNSTSWCTTSGMSVYSWSNGATTACITVSQAATYNVTITDVNGCTASSSRVFGIRSLPICSITDQTICLGGSAEFCSYSFNTTWSTGAGASCITLTTPGAYSVTITGQNGCTSACPFNLINSLPTCTLTAPAVLPNSGSTNNTLGVTSNGVSRVWTLTSSNNSWVIVGSNTGTSVNYTAGTSGIAGTFTVVTTSATGCTSTCSVTFGNTTVIPTGTEYCSKAQGFYGGKGKTCSNQTPTQAIAQALSSGSIILGDGARKLTILPSQVSCVIAKMPSGTTPALLPIGNVTCTNATGSAYLNSGKFKSILLGQTLALALNIRLNASLGTVVIANKYMTTYAATACVNGTAIAGTKQVFAIPQSVLTYMGTNNTVNNLLLLANKALGGTYVPGVGQPSLGDITTALDAINRGFDGCRILVGFSASSAGLKLDDENETIETVQSGINVNAYPNPFTGTTTIQFTLDETTAATLEVYSVTGQRVASLFNGVANAGETYEATFDATQLAAGMYLCKLSTANNAVVHKVILMK